MSFQSFAYFLGFYLNWKIHIHAVFADWTALPTWRLRGGYVATGGRLRGADEARLGFKMADERGSLDFK